MSRFLRDAPLWPLAGNSTAKIISSSRNGRAGKEEEASGPSTRGWRPSPTTTNRRKQQRRPRPPSLPSGLASSPAPREGAAIAAPAAENMKMKRSGAGCGPSLPRRNSCFRRPREEKSRRRRWRSTTTKTPSGRFLPLRPRSPLTSSPPPPPSGPPRPLRRSRGRSRPQTRGLEPPPRGGGRRCCCSTETSRSPPLVPPPPQQRGVLVFPALSLPRPLRRRRPLLLLLPPLAEARPSRASRGFPPRTRSACGLSTRGSGRPWRRGRRRPWPRRGGRRRRRFRWNEARPAAAAAAAASAAEIGQPAPYRYREAQPAPGGLLQGQEAEGGGKRSRRKNRRRRRSCRGESSGSNDNVGRRRVRDCRPLGRRAACRRRGEARREADAGDVSLPRGAVPCARAAAAGRRRRFWKEKSRERQRRKR